jgi:hypothetical protein
MLHGRPHKKLRKNCKSCTRKGHDHTKNGDMCRFHGENAFCRTHKNRKNPIVRKYCKTNLRKK